MSNTSVSVKGTISINTTAVGVEHILDEAIEDPSSTSHTYVNVAPGSDTYTIGLPAGVTMFMITCSRPIVVNIDAGPDMTVNKLLIIIGPAEELMIDPAPDASGSSDVNIFYAVGGTLA